VRGIRATNVNTVGALSVRRSTYYFMWGHGRIQPVRLGGGDFSNVGSQVSLGLRYCKRDEVYFITPL